MTRGADSPSADFSEEDRESLGIKSVRTKKAWPWQLSWILEKEERLQDEPVYLCLSQCQLKRKIKMLCHHASVTGKGLMLTYLLKLEG